MVFYPIPLAILQEFNIFILQMETSQLGGAANPPRVADIVLVPHLSDLKLGLLSGSALQRPLVLKATPPYLFIMWLTGRVYIPQHIYLQGMRNAGKGKNYTALDYTPKLPPWARFVRPHAGDEREFPQSVVVRIKLVIYHLRRACVE